MDQAFSEPSDFYVYGLYRDAAMTLPFYIGKGRRQRMNQHAVIVAKDVSHRANTIRQIVKELGFLPRRKIAENLTAEAAFRVEVELIKQFGGYPDGLLLNRTRGGDGYPNGGVGHSWTPESRAKVSAALKGRKKTPEHVAKVATAHRGKKRSLETREALRLSHLGQQAWNAGKKGECPQLGEKLRGRKMSPEQYEKMIPVWASNGPKITAARTGKPHRTSRATPRKDAREQGLTRYVSGKPCRNGHVGDRFVAGGGCVQCHDERARRQQPGI